MAVSFAAVHWALSVVQMAQLAKSGKRHAVLLMQRQRNRGSGLLRSAVRVFRAIGYNKEAVSPWVRFMRRRSFFSRTGGSGTVREMARDGVVLRDRL